MWLLENNAYARLAKAYEVNLPLTVEQQAEIVAAGSAAGGGNGSRITSISGNTAEIGVKGVLTKEPDFFSRVFGGGNTTYSEIIGALATASANPDVKNVVLNVDSPGGTVDGLFDTLDALQSFDKPLTAKVDNLAASAAFAIVSQASSIEATNPMARFGSIGVAVDFFVNENRVSVTSTEAPDKRPDLTTEEGKAVVRAELDDLHQVFAETIALGRKTTVDKVNANFGKGATVVAAEAKKRGMIDGIAKTSLKSVPSKTKIKSEAVTMDIETLKSEHAAVYVAALALGAEQAVTTERDRVSGFIVMGEASGDMKTALKAIKEGSEMTSELTAIFMMATANNRDINARKDDDVNANAGDGANENSDAGDESAQVLALVQESLGSATA